MRHLIAVVAVALASQSSVQAQSITVGTEGAYPPFNSIDSAGELVGFDVDIAKAICTAEGLACDFVAQDWDGIIPGLLAGKYDVIVASMFITDERKQVVDFTDPYYVAAMTFVGPKTNVDANLLPEALNGAAIGVQSGTTQATYVETVIPGATLRQYRTQDEVNQDLANGRLDYQVADLVPMMEWLKTDEGACCALIGQPITDPDFVGEGVGMALRQEDDDLREAFNRGLATILADGTYERINDTYFDLNLYTME